MAEKKDINVEIGRRVKYAREAAGLTQDKFAELIDLSTQNISAIERGVTGVSATTIKKICSVLSISADLLFSDEQNNFDETDVLINRLKQLTPEQYEIANKMLNTLIDAFSLNKNS